MRSFCKPLLILSLFCLACNLSFSQWNNDTITGGRMIIQNQETTKASFAISDGAGGIIQVFAKEDASVYPWKYSILMQKIDSAGQLRWGSVDSSTTFSEINNNFHYPTLLDVKADNGGGAYILYEAPNNTTNPDSTYLCVQHVAADGSSSWPQPGKIILRESGVAAKLAALTDGGIAVVWRTSQTQYYGQLYAQKITIDGVVSWGDAGVNLSNAAGMRGYYNCTSDGQGGIITVFSDGRNSIYNDTTGYGKLQLFAQHTNAAGINTFGSDGMLSAAMPGDTTALFTENATTNAIVSADSTGCYFIYGINHRNAGADFYIQRINNSGQKPWGDYGSLVMATNLGTAVLNYKLFKSAAGGVASVFSTNGGSQVWNMYHLFLQFHDGAGVPRFSQPREVAVAGTNAFNGDFNAVFDASIGYDGSTALFFSSAGAEHTPQLQLIGTDGSLKWDSAGKTIVHQYSERVQALPGNNGFTLLKWADKRNHPSDYYLRDYFVSRVDNSGNISASRRTITSIANGNWNDPNSWQGGIVPGPEDIAIIENVIQVSANASCYSLLINQPNGNLTVQSGVVFSLLH